MSGAPQRKAPVAPEPPMPGPGAPGDSLRRVEAIVSRALWWGGILGVSIAVGGLTLYAMHGGLHAMDADRVLQRRLEGNPPVVFTSLKEVRRGLTQRPVDPLAVTSLGLVVLAATPVAGLALATLSFFGAGDRQYALIAALVLAALVLSFVLVGGTG